jgi:hypothetical protein
LFAAPIRKCDQRSHFDAPRCRRLQRILDIGAIEAEDRNLHTCVRAFDGRQQRRHTIGGFDNQFHKGLSGRSDLFAAAIRSLITTRVAASRIVSDPQCAKQNIGLQHAGVTFL